MTRPELEALLVATYLNVAELFDQQITHANRFVGLMREYYAAAEAVRGWVVESRALGAAASPEDWGRLVAMQTHAFLLMEQIAETLSDLANDQANMSRAYELVTRALELPVMAALAPPGGEGLA